MLPSTPPVAARARDPDRTRALLLQGRMPVWLIVLLGALSAVGPLSTDMYLPAFPKLDTALGTIGSGQITLAAWFVGLAIGQFSQGPASDRWGRRAPLLAGLAIYMAGTLGCILSHDVWSFSACRVLAAIGGSAGMVIPRAIVRDVATGDAAARLMSQLTLVLGVVPMLAPMLGALVLTVAGWRWIFGIAVVYGAVCVAAVQLALPDTLPPQYRLRLSPPEVLRRYAGILGEPVFLANSCICGCGSFVVFAYLSGTPVIFERILHFSPLGFGMMFGINAFLYILATQVNAQVVTRVGVGRMLAIGMASLSGAALLLILAVLSGLAGRRPQPAVHRGADRLGDGVARPPRPNATVLALGAHARHAGSASAMLGTLQFSFGAVSGLLLGVFATASMLPTALLILAGVAGANVAYRVRRSRPAIVRP